MKVEITSIEAVRRRFVETDTGVITEEPWRVEIMKVRTRHRNVARGVFDLIAFAGLVLAGWNVVHSNVQILAKVVVILSLVSSVLNVLIQRLEEGK